MHEIFNEQEYNILSIMLAKLFFVYIIYFMQALPSGEEGKQVSIGKSGDHRHLNRFKNVTACTYYMLLLTLASFPGQATNSQLFPLKSFLCILKNWEGGFGDES